MVTSPESRLASPRDATRSAIFGLIRRSEGATRGDLIAATGMSRSTVNYAVNRLIESGLVEETELAAKGPGSGRGRPGLALRAKPSGTHVAGIDFGHRHVGVAIADGAGDEIDRVVVSSGLDALEKLDRAQDLLERLMTDHGLTELAQIVAGVPRPLDRTTGRVRSTGSSDGWGGFSIPEEIERRTGSVTHVENDALLGAYGEFRRGAARDLRDVIYIKVAHGVGAGLILNGSPYYGSDGVAGDIGHSRIPGRNERCRNGHRGCLEAIASIGAIEAQIADLRPGANATELLAEEDEFVTQLLEDAGRTLGGVLAYFCNLLGPAAVVIGGSLGANHESFIGGAAWSISEYARPVVAASTKVLAAQLGDAAELTGATQMAAELAVQRIGL